VSDIRRILLEARYAPLPDIASRRSRDYPPGRRVTRPVTGSPAGIGAAFMHRRSIFLIAPILAFAACAPHAVAQQSTATAPNGRQVLGRMRAAYDGVWYPTLTFIQKTVLHRPDGTTMEQRWHESVRYTPQRGAQLRIDAGDLAAGNGTIYTADSSWSVRGGKLTATRARGNEFLPLIQGVYLQPVERTAREVALAKVDLDRTRMGEFRGRPVWVVGTTSAADTTSPQFWVDTARKVLVRMVLHAEPQSPVVDVTLDGYEPVGKAWLGTRVMISADGKLVQEEIYTDWKANVPLADALFDPAQWTTAPHWGRVTPPPTQH
jgi:hypothetical protein